MIKIKRYLKKVNIDLYEPLMHLHSIDVEKYVNISNDIFSPTL